MGTGMVKTRTNEVQGLYLGLWPTSSGQPQLTSLRHPKDFAVACLWSPLLEQNRPHGMHTSITGALKKSLLQQPKSSAKVSLPPKNTRCKAGEVEWWGYALIWLRVGHIPQEHKTESWGQWYLKLLPPDSPGRTSQKVWLQTVPAWSRISSRK